MAAEAVVAGHVCVDLHPAMDQQVATTPGRLFEVGPLAVTPGGCVANTGRDLAALGASVRLVADIGDDALSALLLDSLDAPRLDITGITRRPGRSTSYSVVIQPDGADRAFWHHPGANDQFDPARVDLQGARLLHVGYPPLLERLRAGGGEGLVRLLTAARADGATTSLDLVAFDAGAAAAADDWGAILRRIGPLLDVAVPSSEDLTAALGTPACRDLADAQKLAGMLVDEGVAVAMVKAGALGVALRTGDRQRLAAAGPLLDGSWADQQLTVPALPVAAHSTVGAGDAAAAGLLYGLLRGFGPQRSLLAAAAAGAARLERPGPLPTFEALDRRLGTGWYTGLA